MVNFTGMKTKSSPHIAIIGAGIAGLTTAFMLQRQGCEADVFEVDRNLRGIGAGMGLASNAIKAFDYLGLREEVEAISQSIADFKICDKNGKLLFAVDAERIKNRFRTQNYAVHRGDLHKLLTRKISEDQIHSPKRLVRLEQNDKNVKLQFEDGEAKAYDYVIGADGVNSTVRQCLLPKTIPRYAGYWCWRQVIEMPQKNAELIRAVWSKNGRFGLTPLPENRLYWFACINTDLTDETKNYGIGELRRQFDAYPWEIPEVLALSNDRQLISAPIVDIDPPAKFHYGRILLIGDAAHAATPNMGQGACMAVEDVAVLQDELRHRQWAEAFHGFEKRRQKRTRYIIKNSRRAGKIAQMDQSPLIAGRDLLFRILPQKVVNFPLKRLLTEDFMKTDD